MNKDVMKNYLIRDKAFLRELYEGESVVRNNRILNFASDTKLNTLLRLLHFISNGEIQIKRINFEIIHSNKKLSLIKRTVEKKAALKRLLNNDREVKLKFLKKLSSIYSALLYCLFNED
jgi:hypothetical protein